MAFLQRQKNWGQAFLKALAPARKEPGELSGGNALHEKTEAGEGIDADEQGAE
jgi:hypothetical protein